MVDGEVEVLVELGAAAAPAIPAAPPLAASAPATIVAPRNLDVFMRSNLLDGLRGVVNHRASLA